MGKGVSRLLLGLSLGLSLAGAALFIILFIPRMNVFWLILAPVIFAVYQIPAVTVYALWKRLRDKGRPGKDDGEPPGSGSS